MNVQILYTSLTGCTRKVAQAIYDGIPGEDKSIHDLADGIPPITGDILLLGYWGVSGGPDKDTAEFLKTVSGKAVGVFCTLGYYADTAHARKTLETGLNLVKDRNEVIGGYVCNGAVAKHLITSQGKVPGQLPTEQKEIRWEIAASHPTPAECALAAERFRERIYLYTRCRELGIPFKPVL